MGKNRDKKREPEVRGGWCPSCDACLVFKGQRCPVCGTVDGLRTRNKKPTTQIDQSLRENGY